MPRRLHALNYFGGKSPLNSEGIGRWIASKLPTYKYYVEPFAGMAGVLLCRKKVLIETLNDADGHIMNWWAMIRDRPDEMSHLVDNTPHSREDLMRAWEERDDEDPLRRALNTHIILWAGFTHCMGSKPRFSGMSIGCRYRMDKETITLLSERMQKVSLESLDACDFMAKCLKREDIVIYIDPPLSGRESKKYVFQD